MVASWRCVYTMEEQPKSAQSEITGVCKSHRLPSTASSINPATLFLLTNHPTPFPSLPNSLTSFFSPFDKPVALTSTHLNSLSFSAASSNTFCTS